MRSKKIVFVRVRATGQGRPERTMPRGWSDTEQRRRDVAFEHDLRLAFRDRLTGL